MARRTKPNVHLNSRTSRKELARGREAHWITLTPGKTHLGYQRPRREPKGADLPGRWLFRRHVGGKKYRITALGTADDIIEANGQDVLSYLQAHAKAESLIATPGAGKVQRLTIRQAVAVYIEAKKAEGRPTADAESHARTYINAEIGDLVVDELTTSVLERWLHTIAAQPAQTRPKDNKRKFRAVPKDDDARRKRRATASRVATTLKAALNRAYRKDLVANRDAWSAAKLEGFKNTVRKRKNYYLEIDEMQRLVNAAGKGSDFQRLLRGALLTGARFSSLRRAKVLDFHRNSGRLQLETYKGKGGILRTCEATLGAEARQFFEEQIIGKASDDLIFTNKGQPWKKSEQARPMLAACKGGNIKPCGFHVLRHSYATHSLANGVPLQVVADNLGDSVATTERHYRHAIQDHVNDLVDKFSPTFGILDKTNVAKFALDKRRS